MTPFLHEKSGRSQFSRSEMTSSNSSIVNVCFAPQKWQHISIGLPSSIMSSISFFVIFIRACFIRSLEQLQAKEVEGLSLIWKSSPSKIFPIISSGVIPLSKREVIGGKSESLFSNVEIVSSVANGIG